MIACVEKTAQNADFYQIIDFLTGCSINYSLLVDPDLIGPWLQQFWATALSMSSTTKSLISPYDSNWELGHISNGTRFLMFPSEEELVTSPHLGLQVLQGVKTQLQSAAHLSYCSVQGMLPSMCCCYLLIWKEKSDETEEVIFEEKKLLVTLNFEDEAGPSSPLRPIQVMESEEQLKVAEVLVAISRPRGLSIPGPIQSQSQPQQPSQATDPKDKGKGILVEEPKKKKLTLQQIRALETTNDEEVARKIQAEWDAEEERKRFEELKKTKPKTTLRKPTSLAQERNQMMNFLKGQGYKNLQKLKYPQMKELYDKVQASIKDSFKDFIPMDSEKGKGRCMKEEKQNDFKKKESYNCDEQSIKEA
ncbi:hypothetical protein Tco_0944909 [Tanacetum coccineum]